MGWQECPKKLANRFLRHETQLNIPLRAISEEIYLRFGPVIAGGLAVAPSEGFGLGLGGMSFTVGKMLPKTLVGRRK